MINLKSSHLRINKAPTMMGVWGLLILLGSIMQQFFEIRMDYVLMMWGLLTLIGVVAQAYCLVRGLGQNFGVWTGLIVVGWFITLYIIKLDSGYNIEYVGDLPAIWLSLIGVGYAVTCYHVTKRFWILAGVSFLFAAIMELPVRLSVSALDFLTEYNSLFFGIFAGLPLIVASLPYFYRPEPKPAPAPAVPSSTMTTG